MIFNSFDCIPLNETRDSPGDSGCLVVSVSTLEY